MRFIRQSTIIRCFTEDKIADCEAYHDGHQRPEAEYALSEEHAQLIDTQCQTVSDAHLEQEGDPSPFPAALLTECGGNGHQTRCVKDVEQQEAQTYQRSAEHPADGSGHIRFCVAGRMRQHAQSGNGLFLGDLRGDRCHGTR